MCRDLAKLDPAYRLLVVVMVVAVVVVLLMMLLMMLLLVVVVEMVVVVLLEVVGRALVANGEVRAGAGVAGIAPRRRRLGIRLGDHFVPVERLRRSGLLERNRAQSASARWSVDETLATQRSVSLGLPAKQQKKHATADDKSEVNHGAVPVIRFEKKTTTTTKQANKTRAIDRNATSHFGRLNEMR